MERQQLPMAQPLADLSAAKERRLISKGDIDNSVVNALDAMINSQKTKKASV